jgi:phage terminase large subunit-like protein
MGNWRLWLLEAGRGAGKTLACAMYFNQWMVEHPGSRGRIIAPILADAVSSCIEAPSGLKRVNPDVVWVSSTTGGARVRWPNSSEAVVMATHSPRDVDRLRAAGNRHIDWWEEMAANRQLDKAWDIAQMGLRMGTHPHSIASTTPRNTAAYMKIRAGEDVALTKATTYDNPHNPDDWRSRMLARYEGSRLGRQELYGELLEDVEGALWTPDLLEAVRLLHPVPPLEQVVTAVDPSGSEEGDWQGVITAARDANNICYVLADDSTKGSPEHRYEIACLAAARHNAGTILYEPQYGGDSTAAGLRSAWEHLTRIGQVTTAMPRLLPTAGMPRGPKIVGSKQDRAQPVVMMYEQQRAYLDDQTNLRPRIYHAQPLAALEDQMLTWVPDESEWSPDRIDALVYAVRYMTDGLFTRSGSFGGSAMARARIG